jgi:hypothetical protein
MKCAPAASFVLFAMSVTWAAGARVPDPPRPTVSGILRDQAGRPLPGVMVVSADNRTDQVVGLARSDEAGAFTLPVPYPRFNFGLLSPTHRLFGVHPRGGRRFDLIAASWPPAGPSDGVDRHVPRIELPRVSIVRGRVRDETGAALAGVRIDAVRPLGTPVTTAFSREDGQFAIIVPGGALAFRASAPGLLPVRSVWRAGRLELEMSVAAQTDTVTITTGRTLTFRPADSIDPEYTPPAPVRAFLLFTYGICPSSTPLLAHERRGLKRYWYLDVLRQTPPNPATISTIACTQPSAFQLPRDRTTYGGFEIAVEALPAGN